LARHLIRKLEQYGLLSVEEKQVLESAPSSQRQYEADRDLLWEGERPSPTAPSRLSEERR